MAPKATQTVDSILKGHNLDSSINSYLKILAPLQCTLETCSGIKDDDFGNILMVSPSTTYIYPLHSGTDIRKFNAQVPHMHDFFELLIVLDGEIRHSIEHSESVFHSGSCCLLNRNTVHKEIFQSGATIFFIGISEELVRTLTTDGQETFFPEIEHLTNNPIVKFMLDNLSNPIAREYLDFLPAIGNRDWYRILHNLTEQIFRAIMFPQLGVTYVIKGMLLELFDYLSCPDNYYMTSVHMDSDAGFLIFSHASHLIESTNGRITRSELEQKLNYSGNYINTIVKKYTGMNLSEYGLTFSMKKAADMLCNSTNSITQIMESLHFTNSTFFYKYFKKQFGMSPRQYRLSHTASSDFSD